MCILSSFDLPQPGIFSSLAPTPKYRLITDSGQAR
jgi:hypothetical protein